MTGDSSARGYGCLVSLAVIAAVATFGGWRIAFAAGLVMLGGTALLAVVTVHSGQHAVPATWLHIKKYVPVRANASQW